MEGTALPPYAGPKDMTSGAGLWTGRLGLTTAASSPRHSRCQRKYALPSPKVTMTRDFFAHPFVLVLTGGSV